MSRTLKNILYNFSYQLITLILPLIVTPYISRVLGPNSLGVYSYYSSIANYFGIFIILGLANYGVRTIATSRDDKLTMSTDFCNIYAMQLICGITVFVLYCFYCFRVADDFNVAIILSLYVLSNIFDATWFLNGIEAFKQITIRNIFIKILSACAIFMFVKKSEDLYVYVLIMSLTFLLTQILLWPLIKKKIIIIRPSISQIRKHIKPNLFLFISVLSVSLFKIMDKIMLGLLATKTDVGFYEASEKVIAIPIALITAMGSVMLSKMSSIRKIEDGIGESIINISVIFAMFLTSGMAFGIMGIAKEFIPVFYGDGYDVCISLYLILLPSCLFLGFANVIRTQYLLPSKMDKEYIISAVLGAISNLTINVLLIPKYGSFGAAIGTLVAEVVVCIYQSFIVSKYINVKKYLLDSMPFIISGIVMFSSLYNLNIQVFKSTYVNLCFKIMIGALIYCSISGLQIIVLKKKYTWIKSYLPLNHNQKSY